MKKLILASIFLVGCGVDASDGKTVNVSSINFSCVVSAKEFDKGSFDAALEADPELAQDIQVIKENNNIVTVEACNEILNQINDLIASANSGSGSDSR